MTKEDFERLVEEGIEAIPGRFQASLKNVAVVIERQPSAHHLQLSGHESDWTLYGLYEGVPLPDRGEHYMFTVPDKITIFKNPILEVASSLEEARLIVKNTVWHEFGHYFGLSEDEIQRREVAEGRDRY